MKFLFPTLILTLLNVNLINSLAIFCPNGFDMVAEKCILTFDGYKMNWFESLQFCREKNSRLIEIYDIDLSIELKYHLMLKGNYVYK